jgi:allantoate deiminase
MALLGELARFSEAGAGVTRLYLTPEHRAALDHLGQRMRGAGLSTRIDAAATLIARLEGDVPGGPALLLGSHIDSVREGGGYDGVLGVVLPLICMEALGRSGIRLPYAVEIVVFGDEEGVRFPVTLTGSRALAGTVDPAVLEARDDTGISLADALAAFGGLPGELPAAASRPSALLGFMEIHIEQGPVLEAEGLPVGVVTAIASAARFTVTLSGEAGHAGTVPMRRRRDALAGAAEMILLVERCGRDLAEAVATVGRLELKPDAVNVVPGWTRFTLDLRAPGEERLEALVASVCSGIEAIASRRDLAWSIAPTHRARGCVMAPALTRRLSRAVAETGLPVQHLPSGAGHDAMALAELTPTAMLFVRCAGGVSHNPAESCSAEDVGVAAEILLRFLLDPEPLPAPG